MNTIPILLDLGIFNIYTLGVFLLLAVFWSLFVFYRCIKLTHYKESQFFDFAIAAMFFAFVGGRIFYILLHLEQFGSSISKMLLVNGYPGLSIVGALLGGFGALYFLLRRAKLPLLVALDYFLPAIIIFFVIGKLGSFLAGTDVGTETNFFLRMRFLGHTGLRHPVALYEAILAVYIYFKSHELLLAIRRGEWSEGSALYFGVGSLSLILLAFDKMKIERLYFAGSGFNIEVALLVVVLCAYFFWKSNRSQLVEKFSKLQTLFQKS